MGAKEKVGRNVAFGPALMPVLCKGFAGEKGGFAWDGLDGHIQIFQFIVEVG